MEELDYLEKIHFEKSLKKLVKKMHGKRIIIYGTGKLFDCMMEQYDFSEMNIIAVSDKKYEKIIANKYMNFDAVAPSKIAELKPDYVLVATLRIIDIIEYLRYILLKGTGIKVLPLVQKGFWEILKEIW